MTLLVLSLDSEVEDSLQWCYLSNACDICTQIHCHLYSALVRIAHILFTDHIRYKYVLGFCVEGGYEVRKRNKLVGGEGVWERDKCTRFLL